MTRDAATKLLEILAEDRCPCGHLANRHRKATGAIEGEVHGGCRDCECKGRIDWTEDAE